MNKFIYNQISLCIVTLVILVSCWNHEMQLSERVRWKGRVWAVFLSSSLSVQSPHWLGSFEKCSLQNHLFYICHHFTTKCNKVFIIAETSTKTEPFPKPPILPLSQLRRQYRPTFSSFINESLWYQWQILGVLILRNMKHKWKQPTTSFARNIKEI